MDNKNQEIPDIIVARLPRYLRALTVLREKGNTTNSQELGNFLGFSAAQIRKDLSQFGEFGKQGTGYNIDYLSQQIETILNIDADWKMILVGCGNIGHAILNYSGFSKNRFHIVAAVDSNPELIGKNVKDQITIRSIDEIEDIIKTEDIRIAMLTVPAAEAQKTAEKLVEFGIRGIISYAPILLRSEE
ncbi:MAG: redox-sensing transcriptional repressor Rex, partial [Anaerolineaceae bacterium]|nr:redox-sensing transcriptional repressor Rex [Anaerolineaceae bacterium]